MCPALAELSRRQTTWCASKTSLQSVISPFPWSFLLLRTRLSRDYSSRGLDVRDYYSWGIDNLKVNSFSPEQNRRKNWPPWSSPTFMESVLPPAHAYFKHATAPFQMQAVTEISSHHSSSQEHNLNRYEEISMCKSRGRNPHNSHQLQQFSGYLYTERQTK